MNSNRANFRVNGRWNEPRSCFAGLWYGAGRAIVRGAQLFAFLLAGLLTAAPMARAQTQSVLYSFCSQANCADGADPTGSLAQDAQGNVYGTTLYGGVHSKGTVFKVTASGTETVLHSFAGNEGAGPEGGLIWDAKGNLYGTTAGAGYIGVEDQIYFGSAFELEKHSFKFLHRFLGSDLANGATPTSGLVRDAQGNAYGTTLYGGAYPCGDGYGCGIVFKVSPSRTQTVLYNFSGGADGENPNGSLVIDSDGNLYGTTDLGGGSGDGCLEAAGCGTVFKVTPDGTETVLYRFTGEGDGGRPLAGLVMDSQGNLYGTTAEGGTSCGGVGCGTVFEMSASGTETVLYNFAGGTDGEGPWAGLVRDAEGNLYGTTIGGGVTSCDGGDGCGTVFKVTPGGTETVLYRFTGGTDGAIPYGGLTMDGEGNLYGATIAGGVGACEPFGKATGCGVVFKVTP